MENNPFPNKPTTEELQLLTPAQVARLTGLARSTLARWRTERKGFSYILLGRRAARYPISAVKAWLEVNQREAKP